MYLFVSIANIHTGDHIGVVIFDVDPDAITQELINNKLTALGHMPDVCNSIHAEAMPDKEFVDHSFEVDRLYKTAELKERGYIGTRDRRSASEKN